MFEHIIRRCGRPSVLFAVIATLCAVTSISVSRAAKEPYYHVYLFENGQVEDCGEACSYSENHVYFLTTPIGYRDGQDGTVIRNGEGEQIGFLAMESPIEPPYPEGGE